jgi:hypothetical protein
MKLEISKAQFDQIQNEIINLEEKRPFLYESKDSWGIIYINDRIKELKEIIRTEQIEI